MRPKYLVTILVLLVLAVPASPAHAGGIVSICDEAHLLAALAGGGTVTFACSGTISLTVQITIAADTTIDGSGQAVIVSGNNAVRVFLVNSGVTLNLNELTVVRGNAHDSSGGGVYSRRSSAVIVSNSNFLGNYAYDGGGIASYGTVTVSNSTFDHNHVAGVGGGIRNYIGGTVTVSNSTFSGNFAAFEGSGGGIYNQGALTVSNSTFSGNYAYVYGGGIVTTAAR